MCWCLISTLLHFKSVVSEDEEDAEWEAEEGKDAEDDNEEDEM